MAPRRTGRLKTGRQPQSKPRRNPSDQQLHIARILTMIIAIALATGAVFLFTNNPWGAAIITAIGIVAQSRFDRLLDSFEGWVKEHFPLVVVALSAIGLITIVIVTLDGLLLTGAVQITWRPAPPAKHTPVVAPSPTVTHPPSSSPTPADAISVTTRGNSQIGLSDGRYVFDMGFSDNVVKKQAADAFNLHRYGNAQDILAEAHNVDPTDAEARIYQENARIRASGLPHFTLIAVTTFTASDSKDQHETGASRDILQGACLAQLTYNGTNPAKQLVLLIANVPDPQIDATTVANQIIQAARQDSTIVGVIGWPSGSDDAIETLGKATIPVVSPTSLDITSGAGGYFFSVAPSINDQTEAAVMYAKSHWGVNRAAVFYDPDDPHSNDLATAFINNFRKAGGIITDNNTRTYSTDSPGELIRSANSLIQTNPDLKFFYFAGYPGDARQLLQNINTRGIHVIAGDGLSQMVHCPVSVCPVGSLSGLYFTASASQDEVASLKLDQKDIARKNWLQLKSSDFFAIYQQQFDTGSAGNAYTNGERASSDVILAYDATSAFLYASQHAGRQISALAIQQGLKNMQTLYGVSGHISFGNDGNPQQKAVLILWPAGNELKLQSVPLSQGYY